MVPDWSIPVLGSVSKHGNCHLQKIGKINFHDANNCFNIQKSKIINRTRTQTSNVLSLS